MVGPRSRSGPAAGLAIAIAIAVVGGGAFLLLGGSRDRASASPTPLGSLVGSVGLPAIGTPAPSISGGPGEGSPAAIGSPSAGASPAAVGSASAGTSTAIDPTLLASLPTTIDGVALIEDPDTEQLDASNPANGPDLAGLAVAIAVDNETDDLAVASVVRIRPGVFSDAYFDDWRATFDAGACSQAGGVSATGKAVIGGRDAFTATCSKSGLVTYHVHLSDRDLIVSVWSYGQRQFGRLTVEGIK